MALAAPLRRCMVGAAVAGAARISSETAALAALVALMALVAVAVELSAMVRLVERVAMAPLRSFR